MSIPAIATVLVILICMTLLVTSNISADIVLFGGLILLLITGIITPSQALAGFSNEGMLTIAALYVVAAGLQETGAVQHLTSFLMGQPKGIAMAQWRIMSPVMVMSAFMNNTPVVASFIPALQDWARKNRFPVSKLLIPLSYAAILGGTCTLIGTSTNLIVNGMMIENAATDPINIFTPAWIGLPVAIVGFLYILIVGRWLIPDRSAGFDTFEDPKEYTIEMIVEEEGPLVGKTIEECEFFEIPNVFLIDIYREGEMISAKPVSRRLRGGDRLIFVGLAESILDMQQFSGLQLPGDAVFDLDTPRSESRLVEVVVSPTHPMVGMTIKQGRFRQRYDAFVLAVARNGERIRKRVGDIYLHTGDVLLLETPEEFVEQQKHKRDWYLVSPITDYSLPKVEKAGLAWGILLTMVGLAAFNVLSMFTAAVLACGAMLFSGVMDIDTARDSIDLQVLLVIASALGLGSALQTTGAAETIATAVMGAAGGSPYLSLAATFLLTMVLTEMMTNNAAAVLVFPIALSVSISLGTNFLPYAMTIMVAASASFSTPIGYQTNLMVYGPGGYKFTDFMKVGLPLNLLVFIITVIMVPLIWPL